ncbi:hypothetical protein [Phytobacter diazotrophicus]|uniref:hypothetical protein n=1 Tax=Phytobacter diazotrophicus TaxID=395631 RepID=UPI002FFC30CD
MAVLLSGQFQETASPVTVGYLCILALLRPLAVVVEMASLVILAEAVLVPTRT